ncbi:hypothetical protein DL767_008396 [Monosporascus sp. MG133]|nr:hypothetical protein DL767_008396 [Monosporascus sp. MG133]
MAFTPDSAFRPPFKAKKICRREDARTLKTEPKRAWKDEIDLYSIPERSSLVKKARREDETNLYDIPERPNPVKKDRQDGTHDIKAIPQYLGNRTTATGALKEYGEDRNAAAFEDEMVSKRAGDEDVNMYGIPEIPRLAKEFKRDGEVSTRSQHILANNTAPRTPSSTARQAASDCRIFRVTQAPPLPPPITLRKQEQLRDSKPRLTQTLRWSSLTSRPRILSTSTYSASRNWLGSTKSFARGDEDPEYLEMLHIYGRHRVVTEQRDCAHRHGGGAEQTILDALPNIGNSG